MAANEDEVVDVKKSAAGEGVAYGPIEVATPGSPYETIRSTYPADVHKRYPHGRPEHGSGPSELRNDGGNDTLDGDSHGLSEMDFADVGELMGLEDLVTTRTAMSKCKSCGRVGVSELETPVGQPCSRCGTIYEGPDDIKSDKKRNRGTGQYSYENKWERLCVCGHALGIHAGEAPHPCFMGDSDEPEYGSVMGQHCESNCQKFRPSKKKPVTTAGRTPPNDPRDRHKPNRLPDMLKLRYPHGAPSGGLGQDHLEQQARRDEERYWAKMTEDLDLDPESEEASMLERRKRADAGQDLIALLGEHVGETGESESAVETLERLLEEHDCPQKTAEVGPKVPFTQSPAYLKGQKVKARLAELVQRGERSSCWPTPGGGYVVVSKDMHHPVDSGRWRITMFTGRDGMPYGHVEASSYAEALKTMYPYVLDGIFGEPIDPPELPERVREAMSLSQKNAEFRTPTDLADAKAQIKKLEKGLRKAQTERDEASASQYGVGVRAAEERIAELEAARDHFLSWIASTKTAAFLTEDQLRQYPSGQVSVCVDCGLSCCIKDDMDPTASCQSCGGPTRMVIELNNRKTATASNERIASMTFEEAKAERDRLEDQTRKTGEILRAFPRGKTGLAPDDVKATAEYQTAKTNSDKAFAAQQAFNAVFTKTFAMELKTERANRVPKISFRIPLIEAICRKCSSTHYYADDCKKVADAADDGPEDKDESEDKTDLEHYSFAGFDVVVEYPAGAVREWGDPNGRHGETVMQYDYGFLDGYIGADKEEVDCYVGPNEDAEFVYVVHQNKKPDFDQYDEDKCLIGFESADEAQEAYLQHYDDERFFGGMTTFRIDDFRKRLEEIKQERGGNGILGFDGGDTVQEDDMTKNAGIYDDPNYDSFDAAQEDDLNDREDRARAKLQVEIERDVGFGEVVGRRDLGPDDSVEYRRVELDGVELFYWVALDQHGQPVNQWDWIDESEIDRNEPPGGTEPKMAVNNQTEATFKLIRRAIKIAADMNLAVPNVIQFLKLETEAAEQAYQNGDPNALEKLKQLRYKLDEVLNQAGIKRGSASWARLETELKTKQADFEDVIQTNLELNKPPGYQDEVKEHGSSKERVEAYKAYKQNGGTGTFEEFMRQGQKRANAQDDAAIRAGNTKTLASPETKSVSQKSPGKGLSSTTAAKLEMEFDRYVIVRQGDAASWLLRERGVEAKCGLKEALLDDSLRESLKDRYWNQFVFAIEAQIQKFSNNNPQQNVEELPSILLQEVLFDLEEVEDNRDFTASEEGAAGLIDTEIERRKIEPVEREKGSRRTGRTLAGAVCAVEAALGIETVKTAKLQDEDRPFGINTIKEADNQELPIDLFDDEQYSQSDRTLSHLTVARACEARPRLAGRPDHLIDRACSKFAKLSRAFKGYTLEDPSLARIESTTVAPDGSITTGAIVWNLRLSDHHGRRRHGLTIIQAVLDGEPSDAFEIQTAAGKKVAFNQPSLDRLLGIRREERKVSKGWSGIELSHIDES